jgi:hypothetical protein
MSSSEIVLAILGSSLLSTILGSWFNWEIQRRNYKKEYYKKILDKRIQAYEKTRVVASTLSSFAQQDGHVVHTYLTSEALFNHLCQKVRESIDDSIWLNDKARTILTEFNIYLLNEFSNYIDPSWSNDQKNSEFHKLAIKNKKNISIYSKNLLFIISIDMKSLYRIDTFFDNAGKQIPVETLLKVPEYSTEKIN